MGGSTPPSPIYAFVCAYVQDMASLRKTACLQDTTNTCNLKKSHKISSYYGCPVEVLSPRFLPMEERTALVREMEGEFLNMRKVFISGLPPDSNKEVCHE